MVCAERTGDGVVGKLEAVQIVVPRGSALDQHTSVEPADGEHFVAVTEHASYGVLVR